MELLHASVETPSSSHLHGLIGFVPGAALVNRNRYESDKAEYYEQQRISSHDKVCKRCAHIFERNTVRQYDTG